MIRYPSKRLMEEVAFVAYHMSFSREEVMEMDHFERKKWCEEISKINKKMNEEPKKEKSIEDVI